MSWVLGAVAVAGFLYAAAILAGVGIVALIVMAALVCVVLAVLYVVGCGVVGFIQGIREGMGQTRKHISSS